MIQLVYCLKQYEHTFNNLKKVHLNGFVEEGGKKCLALDWWVMSLNLVRCTFHQRASSEDYHQSSLSACCLASLANHLSRNGSDAEYFEMVSYPTNVCFLPACPPGMDRCVDNGMCIPGILACRQPQLIPCSGFMGLVDCGKIWIIWPHLQKKNPVLVLLK